jgi:hypothetical protein
MSYLYISKDQWGFTVWQVGSGWWHRMWSGWKPLPTLEDAVAFGNQFCATARSPWMLLPKSELPAWFTEAMNPQEF